MAAIRTIIVATDCSETSDRALRVADRIASRAGATIVAVYGAPFSTSTVEGIGVASAFTSRDDCEQMMMPVRHCIEDSLGRMLSPGTPRAILVADQTPSEAIVSAAEERNADLIVIGSRERSRIARAILGSVTLSVLAGSDRPVLIVRERGCDREIRHIVCPFKNTPQSIAATRLAKELADVSGADLRLLHVVDGNPVAPEIASLAGGNVSIEELRLEPDPGRQITNFTKTMDLIVLPSPTRRFADPSVVGTPSWQVVRTAECPVLTVMARKG
jgi:nucleotide-binding universal stress UspA family protein